MGEKLDFSHKEHQNATPRHSGRKQKKRRKGKLYLFYFLIVLIVCGISVALSLTVFFKLDTIAVAGNSKYTKQQIEQISSAKMGTNLFQINKGKIKDSLQKQLPYVETADVCIKLPTTLSITIKEATAIGYFEQNNMIYILSSNNKILEAIPTTSKLSFAEIDGIKLKSCKVGETAVFADQNFADALFVLNQTLAEYKMDKITKIDITDYLNLKIVYDNRITITFGTQVDLANKVNLTKNVINNDISRIERGTINATNSKEVIFKPS